MTATTVISYPIPAYQNVPIEPQFYQPSRFVISGITLGQTTTITTTVNVNYSVGQLVRLIIPPSFGTIQLNEMTGYVMTIPTPNSVILNINSQTYDPFIVSSATTQAQILAIGDVNTGYQATNGYGMTQPNIPGSFTNISPL